jgi:hypothetical protein
MLLMQLGFAWQVFKNLETFDMLRISPTYNLRLNKPEQFVEKEGMYCDFLSHYNWNLRVKL